MDTSHNAKPQKNEIPIFWIFAAFIITISNDAYAQSHDQQVRERIDNALKARDYKTSYDTNYIVRLNQSGN